MGCFLHHVTVRRQADQSALQGVYAAIGSSKCVSIQFRLHLRPILLLPYRSGYLSRLNVLPYIIGSALQQLVKF